MTRSPPGPAPDDDLPARPPEPRDGTLYVQGEDDDEPSADGREARGRRASTVLTALLVAVGLALPGVAVFLRRPAVPSGQGERLPVAPTVQGELAGANARPGLPSAQAASKGVDPRPDSPSALAASEGLTVRPVLPSVPSPPARADARPLPSPSRTQGALARVDPRPVALVRQPLPAPSAPVERLRAVINDASLPPAERSAAALTLLDAHSTRERWRSLVRDADLVSGLDLPLHEGRLPAEHAAWSRLQALRNLDQWDAVLRDGPAFLRTYPGSVLASSVDMLVRSTLIRHASEAQGRRAMQAQVQEAEEEAAREVARLEGLGQPTAKVRRSLDFRRCDLPGTGRFYPEALAPCRAFIANWGAGKTSQELNEYRDARGLEIISLVALRRYTEARERLAAFLASDPEGEQRTSAHAVVLGIPAEAEE